MAGCRSNIERRSSARRRDSWRLLDNRLPGRGSTKWMRYAAQLHPLTRAHVVAQWFDRQKAYLDSLESQLRGLVKAIDLVTKHRSGEPCRCVMSSAQPLTMRDDRGRNRDGRVFSGCCRFGVIGRRASVSYLVCGPGGRSAQGARCRGRAVA